MTSAAQAHPASETDWRIIVSSGAKMGAVTAIGVVLFALLSRGLAGSAETLVQGLLLMAGIGVFAFGPSMLFRPRDVDSIAWVAMIGLLGALFFTVIDTALLRPFDLYHWTWDAIGGGSGFWYIPVWWMGAAVLAWLGAWTVAIHGRKGEPNIPVAAGQTVGVGIVATAILIGVGVVPFHAAGIALGLTVGLVLGVPIAGAMHRG